MDLMDLVAGRVEILVEGEYHEENVEIDFREEFTLDIPEEMKTFATQRFLERQAKNPKLFDGDARHLSLKHSQINPNSMRLAVGPLKYSVYDACRMEFIERLGLKMGELPTGMGSNVVTVTEDSKIAMHKRGPHVDLPGKISLIGGIYDGDSPFTHIVKELWEELGIVLGDIRYILLLSITNRLPDRLEARIGHEFNFLTTIDLSSEELLKLQEAVSEKEGELFFIGCEPQELHNYIKKNHEKLLAGDVVALVLAGRYIWGRSWSEIQSDERSC